MKVSLPECSSESPSKDRNDRDKYLIKMYDGCGIRSVYFYSYTALGAVKHAKEKYPAGVLKAPRNNNTTNQPRTCGAFLTP